MLCDIQEVKEVDATLWGKNTIIFGYGLGITERERLQLWMTMASQQQRVGNLERV